MPRRASDRELLFGVLSTQVFSLDRDRLVDAIKARAEGDDRPIGEILVDRKLLEAADRALLDEMVDRLVDDPANGLDEVESLAPDLRRELDRDADDSLATATPAEPFDPFATRLDELDDPGRGSVMPGSAPEKIRYRKVREHAKGGLGVVFIARDEELNRDVALKEIKDRHADSPNNRARFVLEAEVTGGLEHPGIVPVYGLGQHPNGRPYYAMRFIRGDSLMGSITAFHADESLKLDPGRRNLALQKLLQRFIDVCNAIDYAHSRGVIHRDLKPQNIMMGRYGETLVVDWGLAKTLGPPIDIRAIRDPGKSFLFDETFRPSSSSASTETQAGSLVGTPAYMSPEQAEGRVDLLGTASDVYGLGATLYHLLAGRPPVDGKDLGELLAKVRSGDFPRPRESSPWLDPALQAICLKAMSLKPEDRYATPRALAEDVESWIAEEPIAAYPEPWRLRARRWMARHRTGVAAIGAAALVGLAACFVFLYKARLVDAQQRIAAQVRVDALLTSQIRSAPTIIEQLRPDRRSVLGRLERLARGEDSNDEKIRIRAALALLDDHEDLVEFAVDYLLRPSTGAEEVLVIREMLSHKPQRDPTLMLLRSALSDGGAKMGRSGLHAAGAMARLSPRDPAWSGRWEPLARALVEENTLDLGIWREVFQPVANLLTEPLRRIYADRTWPDPRSRERALGLLLEFALQPDNPDRVEDLVTLLGEAEEGPFRAIFGHLLSSGTRERAIASLESRLGRASRSESDPARRTSRWAMALLRLGISEPVWPLLRHRADPGLRSDLIHNLAGFGIEARTIVDRLEFETDTSARRSLVLALGEFPDSAIGSGVRLPLAGRLASWYRADPDPGVHGAVGWLMRRWGLGSDLDAIDRQVAGLPAPEDRGWYVNNQGQTYTVLRGPAEFLMGSPEGTSYRRPDEVPHRAKIGRSFAIATREVTVAQYVRFLDANPSLKLFRPDRHEQVKDYLSDPENPITTVNWYDCARYCNWLSKEEGIPESQWCYPSEIAREIHDDTTLTFPPDSPSRTGYRLPTEAEWEFACRAGSTSIWPFGDSEEWLARYAWFSPNAGLTPHPVGRLRPNDLGLFDTLGNVFEWLNDPYSPYRATEPGGQIVDLAKNDLITPNSVMLLRGGVFYFPASGVRPACRDWIFPTGRDTLFGFRPARTCPGNLPAKAPMP